MVTDQELWEAVKRSDEQAFTTLFHRYSSRIYSNAYSYVRDKEVCEEIVHDIFITIWLNREQLQVHSFQAYLTSASRYRVYKYITAAKIFPVQYKENMEDHAYAEQNNGYTNIAYQELEQKVDFYLRTLPKRCREILLMSRRQQLSNHEIAKELRISKRTVENQITQALKHLRISLKDITLFLIIMEGLNKLNA